MSDRRRLDPTAARRGAPLPRTSGDPTPWPGAVAIRRGACRRGACTCRGRRPTGAATDPGPRFPPPVIRPTDRAAEDPGIYADPTDAAPAPWPRVARGEGVRMARWPALGRDGDDRSRAAHLRSPTDLTPPSPLGPSRVPEPLTDYP